MKIRLVPSVRRGVVGFLPVVKIQSCITGTMLGGKTGNEEFLDRQEALSHAERAASVTAWNMNAKADRTGGAAYRVRPC